MLKANIRYKDQISGECGYIMKTFSFETENEIKACVKGFAAGFSWHETNGHIVAEIFDENNKFLKYICEEI